MHLKHIKLAGFKSFVDPTTVSVPARIIGVVGPNGCGKSNVIDAVRWVMGESSAKTLRGDSMADVIFNGSSARKPVGKAAVELVFDNTAGAAPGPYASFSEIAIRRELSRDGQSNYFINKTRCRRRDITDIFLGTGLGPRSYSIIEQGMVSRVIESKPEELRVLIEEAAGVSKYKERRRETENRIRHTKENLDRVADICSELETQLRRLKRQSGAAERYKLLKTEERLTGAQLLSLRWRSLDSEAIEKDKSLARLQTTLDSKLAEQRGAEREIEHLRSRQSEVNEQFHGIQAEFYGVSGEIASAEQEIEYVRQTREQQRQELSRLEQSGQETSIQLETDVRRLAEIQQKQKELAQDKETARLHLDSVLAEQADAERVVNEWQAHWDEFSNEAARPEREKQVQNTRITEHQAQMQNMREREQRLEQALENLESQVDEDGLRRLRKEARDHDELCEQTGKHVDELDRKIEGTRNLIEEISERADEARDQYHEISAKLTSLRELQSAALGEHDEELGQWLRNTGLNKVPRLAGELAVEPGWERAVDRVLGGRAGALCVESLAQVPDAQGVGADLFLVERSSPGTESSSTPGLSGKVASDSVDLSDWLADVLIADDFDSAMAMRPSLVRHQSVVTREGFWIGKNWLALASNMDSGAGVLLRGKEISRLASEIEQSGSVLSELKGRAETEQQNLFALEEDHGEQRRVLRHETEQRAQVHNRLGRVEARTLELNARREQMQSDLQELRIHMQQALQAIDEAQGLLKDAESATRTFAQKRDELVSRRDDLKNNLQQINAKAIEAREALHVVQSELMRIETEISAVTENIERLQNQFSGITERQQQLQSTFSPEQENDEKLETRLKGHLELRMQVESRLADIRTEVEKLDESVRSAEQNRVAHEQGSQEIRADMETTRISRQEVIVRRDTVEDQVVGADYDARVLLQEMPDDADEALWQESVDKIAKKIERIGPVNLVAIEEYEEQAERKTYLDNQHEDLSEALATLDSVIKKIDGETRDMFRETFDNLNTRFQQFFPRLFGGGSAYLELTGSDLLDTGVAVMARPPGKRNSTIHLLSGGEKALTAVALLFSFFDLNPAPFCVLDEVDAPLDDTNVERYTEILKTLSDRTQLIFITHNKITMECANILIGVTMMEPGVSRLVSVDVEEAVKMAAQ